MAENWLLGCACIFSACPFNHYLDGDTGKNNGIWGSPSRGGSTWATSIFIDLWGNAKIVSSRHFYAYRFSIHLIASMSVTVPKYRWVVAKWACRMMTLLTISIGVPYLEGWVAAWRRRSWGRKLTPASSPAFFTTTLSALYVIGKIRCSDSIPLSWINSRSRPAIFWGM